MGICKFGAIILKLISRIFGCICVLFLIALLVLQTPFAKEMAKNTLITLAHEKGVELRIEKIDGLLPFDWKLKNVRCSYRNEEITCDQLKFRLSLTPLFQKELEVSYLKISGGSYRGVPFSAVAKGKLDLNRKNPIKISNFLVEGEELFFRLEGTINSDFTVDEGNFAFYLPDLSIFDDSVVKGSLMGMGQITKEKGKLECFGEDLSVNIDATRDLDQWVGEAKIEGAPYDIPVTGSCSFQFAPRQRHLYLDDLKISRPELMITGSLGFKEKWEGSIHANCHDLRIFQALFPKLLPRGNLDAHFDFNPEVATSNIELKNFAFFDTSGQSLSIKGTILDLYGAMHGDLEIKGQEVVHEQMKLAKIEFKTKLNPEESPFEFEMQGTWVDPLLIRGAGNFHKQLCQVEMIEGFALKRSISLQAPFTIDWNQEHFKMSAISIDIGYGHLLALIDLDKTSSVIKVNAKEFPLEFIPIFYKHFSLVGTSTFDIDLIGRENKLQGSCNLALERAHFLSEGLKDPYTSKGSVQIHINGNKAQIHGELKAKDKQFINLIGSFPIRVAHFPFKIALDPEEPFASELTAEGKLEDLFNFINIGQHRIEGWVSTKLHGSKTLKDPSLQGTFELQDGLYENYYTGTCLKEIYAEGVADNKVIRLTKIEAGDGDAGKFTASGELELKPQFPFSLTADIDDFDALSYDTLTGTCSGQVTLTGSRLGSLAKGKLKVHNATFRIPDQMRTIFPELPIQFINPPEKITANIAPLAKYPPLELDLEIHVPKECKVEGRGLNAELKGRVHLTGTHKKVSTQGKLQLISGEYIFSGKVFKLTQGEIIFNDKGTRNAYIALSGNCDLPEVNVTVILEGPITSPKLSFQSSPQMPTSSLLARILFNKDISEISAVQALQIAQTVISLSGNSGPDILEKIRRTIGIDRLTLITSENDPGKISLQIGKYLMRGVLLTLSQGAESRNVSVEVDLRKGIKFQAEFNEEQQGKFSLKWHHHY